MGDVIKLKKFFPETMNRITRVLINKDCCPNDSAKKLEKEPANKERLLLEKTFLLQPGISGF